MQAPTWLHVLQQHALQYGVPLSALASKFSHMRFEPSGFTNNRNIPYAKSIFDYIFRWLALKFLPAAEQHASGSTNEVNVQIVRAPWREGFEHLSIATSQQTGKLRTHGSQAAVP